MTTSDIDRAQPFGILLRLTRERAGLTQKELARSAGISLATVRDLEQLRNRGARKQTVQALAAALGTSATETDHLLAAAAPTRPASPAAAWSKPSGRVAGLSILGPLMLEVSGVPVKLGSQGQRTVLGLLALNPNAIVTRTQIIDALWPDEPPDRAVNVVQTFVARTRRLLVPAARSLAIRSVPGGYLLEAGPAVLDCVKFDELLQAAHAVGPDHLDGRLRQLSEALDLWRGDPLSDVETLVGHPARLELQQRHLTAVLDFAAAAAASNRYSLALPRLRAAAHRHPLNEPVHARLVEGLARSGHQAGALDAYERIRASLAEDLGIDPGPELRQLHQQVLRQELNYCPAPRPTVAVEPRKQSVVIAAAATSGDSQHARRDARAPSQSSRAAWTALDKARPQPPLHAYPRLLRWAVLMVTILALGSGSAASMAIGRDVTQAPAAPTPDGEQTEQTPASCLHRAVQHRDGRRPSTTWPTEFVCDNIGGIPLYSEPDGRRKIGEMLTTQSWFLCWAAGAEQTTGERIWYYTQGDISEPDAENLEAWGYFPASMVKSADKPPSGMPPCGK